MNRVSGSIESRWPPRQANRDCHLPRSYSQQSCGCLPTRPLITQVNAAAAEEIPWFPRQIPRPRPMFEGGVFDESPEVWRENRDKRG